MNLIKHPAFADVNPEFLASLQNTIDTASKKGDLEMVGTLMAISNEAKKKNIHFTPAMQVALLEYLKSKIPANKHSQFDAFLSMVLSKMS